MGILAGRTQPDSGRILVDGRLQPMVDTKTAISAGIGMVYQHFMLVEAMTVAENVFLGQEPGFFINPAHMADQVKRLATSSDCPSDPEAKVSDLSMGEKQRVEILRLLHRQSRILIFDEPTAVLTPDESEQLFDAFARWPPKARPSSLSATNSLKSWPWPDTITILKKGAVIDSLPATAVASRADLARRMVGREVLLEVDREAVDIRQRVFASIIFTAAASRAFPWTCGKGKSSASSALPATARTHWWKPLPAFGRRRPGRFTFWESSLRRYFSQPRQKDRLSYIPEDRQGLATVLELDLVDNFC